MDKDDLVKRLLEPRLGIHEDGTEELKSWKQMYDQCQEAADALSRRDEVSHDSVRDAKIARLEKALGTFIAWSQMQLGEAATKELLNMLRLDAELRRGK